MRNSSSNLADHDNGRPSSLPFWRRAALEPDRGGVLPYRLSRRGGPWNTLVGAPRRRKALIRELQRDNGKPDDITVIIAVRNRSDYRLRNALWSIRHQDYPQDLIRITVVDYDSEPDAANAVRGLCEGFDVDILTAGPQRIWNGSHALNIAIRRASTKFVLSSDVDVLFAPNYVSVQTETLNEQPIAMVCSQCQDLPESVNDQLARAAADDEPLDLAALKAVATPRTSGSRHPGINGAYTMLYHHMRGYDEFYEGWGQEDNDIDRRFFYLGAARLSIMDRTYYLHQWHPKFEGVANFDMDAIRERNRVYYESAMSIVRNPDRWGDLDLPSGRSSAELEHATEA